MPGTVASIAETENLAYQIFRYRLFSNKFIAKNITSTVYQPNTVIRMAVAIRHFIKTNGTKQMYGNEIFWNKVKQLMDSKVQPLTPSIENRLRKINRKSKKSEPVCTTSVDEKEVTNPLGDSVSPECVAKMSQLRKTQNTHVGLRSGNIIRLFDNEDQLSGYLLGMTDLGKSSEFQKVTVVLK